MTEPRFPLLKVLTKLGTRKDVVYWFSYKTELHVGHRAVQFGEKARAARLVDVLSGSTDRCVMVLSPR